MRKILACLLLLCGLASAYAGSLTLLGAGTPPAAAAPPTFSYLDAQGASSPTSTSRSATLNFGSGVSNQRIYVFYTGGFFSPAIQPSTSFIGGSVNPDLYGNAQDGGGSGYAIYWASASQSATGSQTVTLDFASALFAGNMIAAYAVDASTLLSTTPVISCAAPVTLGTTISPSVATLANGSIVSILTTSAGTSGQSITSSTASLTTDFNTLAATTTGGHANGTAATGTSTVNFGWTGSSDAAACNFAFR